MPLSGGTCLGRYRLASRVGRGGMGEVYKAYDASLQRHVALKILPTELVASRDRVERFILEARSASALNHPNIITIYDIGEERVEALGLAKAETLHYIAMELIEGSTLRDEIHVRRAPLKRLLGLLVQVADGLAKAHGAGIVHRDLKPDNIMVTVDGYAKIVDFGLAKLLEPYVVPSGELSEVSTAFRTREGALLGTVGYMSPEQVEARATDHRSDIFSFGCVLYEAFTSHRPFEADSEVATLHKILHEEPRPIELFVKDFMVDASRIIKRCLAKKPQDRYQSIKDAASDLRELVHALETQSGAAAGASMWSPAVPRLTRVAALVGASVLAVLGAVFVARTHDKPEKAAPQIHSLAVLPLANLSADPDQEFFVDGMHEALIAELAQIKALRVISRTSVMQYRKRQKSLPEIARELNVDAVVEGSVARADDRVRVTAQLIEAATDRHLWAKSYDRPLQDVLGLQSEVARAIVSQIRVALTPQEEQRLGSSRVVNPAAYDAVLKAEGFRELGLIEGYRKSMDYSHHAIALDPSYAPGWASLGSTYNFMALFGHMHPKQAAAHAKPAILKALELDPDIADGHVALATLLLRYELDWAGAEREYKRAIELNPGSATAHREYSWYLTALGRVEEAIGEGQRVMELDPMYGDSNLGWIYVRVGRYDQAIMHYRRGLQLAPSPWRRANLALSYALKGQFPAAAAECDTVPAGPRDMPTSGVCAWIYGVAGRVQDARMLIRGFAEPNRTYADPYFVAVAYAGLGEKGQVLAWLEKAYEERSPSLWGIRYGRWFDFVRNDPRFKALLRRMNVPSGVQ